MMAALQAAALGLAVMAPACATAPAGLKILSRSEWGAKPPTAAMKPHRPSRITIHHTATPQKLERALQDKMQALQRFSQNEGQLANGKPKPAWPDVPYHFYIDCKGGVAEGRDVGFVGDTSTEYDPAGHVLVVLEGNFEEAPVPDAQWSSLVKVVSWLAAAYRVVPGDVRGHRDYAQTLCPGKHLEALLPKLRESLP
jgi:hypothetical protein